MNALFICFVTSRPVSTNTKSHEGQNIVLVVTQIMKGLILRVSIAHDHTSGHRPLASKCATVASIPSASLKISRDSVSEGFCVHPTHDMSDAMYYFIGCCKWR